jgi:hypothetical protein
MVLAKVSMVFPLFWDVTPYILVPTFRKNMIFPSSGHKKLNGKMEAGDSSATAVSVHQNKWLLIPGGSNLHRKSFFVLAVQTASLTFSMCR